jgi:predicted permease
MAGRILDGLWRDVRVASRRLVRDPIFTAFAVLSLAAGLGVTVALAAVLASIFPKSPGVEHPEDVVVLTRSVGPIAPVVVSPGDLDVIAARQTTLAAVGATAGSMQTIRHGGLTATVPVEAVRGSYFEALRARVALGRDLRPGDETGVVIGHAFWRGRLGADPGVVGRAITIGGDSYVVVGVADPSFRGFFAQSVAGTAAWIPLAEQTSTSPVPRLTAFGRLRSDRTPAQAQSEIAGLARALDEVDPRTRPDGAPQPRAWAARSLDAVGREQRSRITPVAGAFAGLLVLGLLVACTNLSNLALARGASRRADLATRAALGASRWRLIRQECVESALVLGLGALGAAAIMRVLLVVLARDLPVGQGQILRLEPTIGGPVLLAASGALVVAFLLAGLHPALTLTRGLRQHAGAQQIVETGGRGGWTLLRWQMVASTGLLLVVAIGLRISLEAMRHDPGLELDRLAVARVTGADGSAPGAADVDVLLSRLGRENGLESVAAVSGMPFGLTGTPLVEITTEGGAPPLGLLVGGTGQMLETLGVEVVAGRRIDELEMANGTPVAMVNERAARRLFGAGDPMGREIAVRQLMARGLATPRALTIVGVARDTDVDSLFGEGLLVYAPLDPETRVLAIVARAGDTRRAAGILTAGGAATGPGLVLGEGVPARSVLAPAYVLIEFLTRLASLLGGLTLLLAMLGLYGVLSQVLAHRRRELGVRMALGASPARLAADVLRQGLSPVVWGLVLGLGFGIAGRLLVRVVGGGTVTAVDPLAFGLVTLVMLATGTLACYAPARRAARTDPSRVLRDL